MFLIHAIYGNYKTWHHLIPKSVCDILFCFVLKKTYNLSAYYKNVLLKVKIITPGTIHVPIGLTKGQCCAFDIGRTTLNQRWRKVIIPSFFHTLVMIY